MKQELSVIWKVHNSERVKSAFVYPLLTLHVIMQSFGFFKLKMIYLEIDKEISYLFLRLPSASASISTLLKVASPSSKALHTMYSSSFKEASSSCKNEEAV